MGEFLKGVAAKFDRVAYLCGGFILNPGMSESDAAMIELLRLAAIQSKIKEPTAGETEAGLNHIIGVYETLFASDPGNEEIRLRLQHMREVRASFLRNEADKRKFEAECRAAPKWEKPSQPIEFPDENNT
jgi:glycogen debranching enzyme